MKTSHRAQDKRQESSQTLHKHIGILCAVALQLTHDIDKAEAIVQNTLANAIRHPEWFSNGSKLKSVLLHELRRVFSRQQELDISTAC